jgi:hypothetical protein
MRRLIGKVRDILLQWGRQRRHAGRPATTLELISPSIFEFATLDP